MLIGQAPGPHEESRGRPFSHTAGRTLFQWLGRATGADEATLRELIYFAAVLRCYPGKNPRGKGDRPPGPVEIANCREFLSDEIHILRPRLILAVGRTALTEVLGPRFTARTKLEDVVGQRLTATFHGHATAVIPLPHPSGLSRWPRVEPGLTKLNQALALIAAEFRALEL
jgi:uracil-DNA glycosylase